MKSSFNKGDAVSTNRKYKKRFDEELSGKVLANSHFGRFVQFQTDDGNVHSVKPEFLDQN